jgi:rhodanese-related sulfurtransferase
MMATPSINPAETMSVKNPAPWRDMVLLLATAALLGLVYNSVSPLGVRPDKGDQAVVPLPAANLTAAESPKSGPVLAYHNESISMSLEAEGTPATVATAPAPTAPPPAPTVVPNAPALTWPETKKLLAGGTIVLVDARMGVYYETEHIPGAVSLPANATPAELSAFAAKFPKTADIVVYCGSAQCPLSNQLIAILTVQMGYTHVRSMPGGFVEYRQMESNPAKGGSA